MGTFNGKVWLTLLERDADGWVLRFRCEDREDFMDVVDSIKTAVPSFARSWVKEDKCWWVQDGYLSSLASLFVNYRQMRNGQPYEAPKGKTSKKQQDDTPAPVRASYASLHLLPDAPPEVVKAAYRACAAIHHPDHGGSTERMKQINLAFELAYQWAMQHQRKSA